MNDATFLVLFLAMTAIMAVIPFLFRRIGVPSVIALLVVGMLVGDTGIGIGLIPRLARFVSFLSPADAAGNAMAAAATASAFTGFIDMLGSLGLMFLMALAGMEADFKLIKSCKRPVLALSVLTFLIPAIGGFLVYRHYLPNAFPGQILYASLFASHSVGIVFPVMRELKLSQTRFGASVLIATVITDVLSIIMLAVAVQMFRQEMGIQHNVINGSLSLLDSNAQLFGRHFLAVFVGIVFVYLGLTVTTVHRFGKWIVRRMNMSEDLMITLMLMIILVAALVGELFGINFIVGSFIAGLGLSRVVRQQDMLLFKRFESIGYGFLIPFLFVSIGMKSDFRVFAQAGSFSKVLLTVIVLIGTKIGSGFLAMRMTGFKERAGLAAGLMTVPQLSATLTAAAIGKGLGILDPQFFNAIIILSVVTTLPVPSLVRAVIYGSRTITAASDLGDDFTEPGVTQDIDLM
ncbi:MAG: cation:proton antiporter [Kiritimatiellae bacterium]|nr:cation:proton antiporter [Kiritimatiellia bacterium]